MALSFNVSGRDRHGKKLSATISILDTSVCKLVVGLLRAVVNRRLGLGADRHNRRGVDLQAAITVGLLGLILARGCRKYGLRCVTCAAGFLNELQVIRTTPKPKWKGHAVWTTDRPSSWPEIGGKPFSCKFSHG